MLTHVEFSNGLFEWLDLGFCFCCSLIMLKKSVFGEGIIGVFQKLEKRFILAIIPAVTVVFYLVPSILILYEGLNKIE
jgi:hypothetical protein